MKLSDFDFDLPPELIAQRPAEIRDASRLMVVERRTGEVRHGLFRDLPDHLRPGDVIVVNDSRVLPARLIGRKPTGGKVDVLLLARRGPRLWEVLVKGLRSGPVLFPGELAGQISMGPDGTRQVEFDRDPENYLKDCGLMPLPPYIRRTPDGSDRERYQTVYAGLQGSVAAPTAGLHFTESLLVRLKAEGMDVVKITLHVGPGTFMPVKCEDIGQHRMPAEPYFISPESAQRLNRARLEGRRIIAVGTTATRTLESALKPGGFVPGHGSTALFISPGIPFRAVGALVTNFHLPKATPLMLVSAFLGLEKTLAVYGDAVRERYRFFSYGDAMLIL